MKLVWIFVLPCFAMASPPCEFGDIGTNFTCEFGVAYVYWCTWVDMSKGMLKWRLWEYSRNYPDGRDICDNEDPDAYQAYTSKLSCASLYGNSLKYTFVLEGVDRFRCRKQTFLIYAQHNKPQDLKVNIRSSSGLQLTWRGHRDYVDKHLQYDLQYRPKGELSWTGIDIMNQTQYLLKDLAPYTTYEIRIKCKLVGMIDDDRVWSQFTDTTAITLSTIPASPPEVVPGGFQEISRDGNRRDIIIYWKSLPQNQRNGPEFHYKLGVQPNGLKNEYSEKMTTNTFERFDNMSTNESFTFTIRAGNINGTTSSHSIVKVLEVTERLPYVEGLSAFIDYPANYNYQILWREPLTSNLIDNYTIFFCHVPCEIITSCPGTLHWRHVEKWQNGLNWTLPEERSTPIRFAIASNSKGGSSGLVWSKCGVQSHDEADFVVPSAAPVADDTIAIQLKKGCHFEITDKLLVEYQVADPSTKECKEGAPVKGKSIEIPVDGDIGNIVVGHLLPNTKYIFKVTSTAGGRDSESESVCAYTTKDSGNPISTIIIIGVSFVTVIFIVSGIKRVHKFYMRVRYPEIRLPGLMKLCLVDDNSSVDSIEERGKQPIASRYGYLFCLTKDTIAGKPYKKSSMNTDDEMQLSVRIFPPEFNEFGSTHNEDKSETAGGHVGSAEHVFSDHQMLSTIPSTSEYVPLDVNQPYKMPFNTGYVCVKDMGLPTVPSRSQEGERSTGNVDGGMNTVLSESEQEEQSTGYISHKCLLLSTQQEMPTPEQKLTDVLSNSRPIPRSPSK